jgi:MarR family transcriptional regulator, organic hydroperoxide resistance regulator
MEGAGYLTRQRDPEDERQVRIRLTRLGRSAREKSVGTATDLLKRAGLIRRATGSFARK